VIVNADCIKAMQDMETNSIDTIITDPPYGLSFMGKKWDYDVPSVEMWKEALRVAKPGAVLLSFAGSRTAHRMTVAIEDAGWEIRDTLMWLYGSGFPKSLNIGKAIDRNGGAKAVEYRDFLQGILEQKLLSETKIAEHCGVSSALVRFWRLGERTIQENEYLKIKDLLNLEGDISEVEREKILVPTKKGNLPEQAGDIALGASGMTDISKGNSGWDGWGTALKPAYEPIVLAMKPVDKTFANNALKHGVAGLNIDGGRIEADLEKEDMARGRKMSDKRDVYGEYKGKDHIHPNIQGRFPANILLDEEAAEMLDEQSGITKTNPMGNNNNAQSTGVLLSDDGSALELRSEGSALHSHSPPYRSWFLVLSPQIPPTPCSSLLY